MKKIYTQPQTDAILLAPSRDTMTPITLGGSPTAGEPGKVTAPGRKVTVLYV